MIIRQILCILLSLSFITSFGQYQPKDYSASEILQRLDKINTLGSAMYVAAHPDDENTRLIAYLSNGMHLRTAYMAATRGDGGQNLIGPEIREGLGVIRTQELLGARYVDGGEQFFSRANDFGFSKHPDETFNVWDKDKVLADFVWNIRKFKPEVLITRFNRQPGVTHGHHTASAILAAEAFEKSGDPKAFPEQLKYVDVWQPKRIFWNTSTWFFSRSGQAFDPNKYLTLDVGQYSPLLGQSFTEISALSRSMHKSQGFGDSGDRGTEVEYFEQWGGDPVKEMFEGIDLSWGKIEGADKVAYFLAEARRNFDPASPDQIMGELLNARKELIKLPEQYWKEVKLGELRELLLLITGTFLELTAEKPHYAPGDSANFTLEAINRSSSAIKLTSLNFSINDEQFIYNLDLENNQKNSFTYQLVIPTDMQYTNPYWLNEKGTEGMYTVHDQKLIGLPQNPAAITARATIKAGDQFVDFELPVIYSTTDPVRGEVRQPLEIQPPVMVNMDAKSLVFTGANEKNIRVSVIAGRNRVAGELKLTMPQGWSSTPASYAFDLKGTNSEELFVFKIQPPKAASEGTIVATAIVDGKTYTLGRQIIDYDHIPRQTIYSKAQVKAVKIEGQSPKGRIGYIMGAGDEVPQALEQIGFAVDLLDKDQVVKTNLMKYDAVILGVRAFNTVSWLSFKNSILFEYVKDGGNLIVQYNTSHRLVTSEIAPYELSLSRDRVTVEESPVTILASKHDVLNKPYKIKKADFDGWVQERGLYFPDKWDSSFTSILSMNDPGETAKEGSLLVAGYGKGYYCYTGISFFRELPAGVAGAYKLLVNMISLGDQAKP